MVKTAHLNDAFSEFFELKANPVEGQSQQQKTKLKYEKPKDINHFLVQKLKNLKCSQC